MSSPRRVAVFASTRADLWPLAPVVDVLAVDARADMALVLPSALQAGEHELLRELALPSDAVEPVEACVAGDRPEELVRSASALASDVSSVLAKRRPDLMLVLGDRHELLGVVGAALVHGVPVAHLHGGEVTEGAFDDAVRDAVTKLAHLHFCAAEPYADRVRSMGEEGWRVHVTGAPGLDRLVQMASSRDQTALEGQIGVPLRRPLALVTYHPPTLAPDQQPAELEAIISACAQVPTIIATHPGPDPGSAAIIARLHRWREERAGVVVVPSLGALYPTALATADLVVGNSSSGVIEAPTFGIPVVNVGDRQRGRLRAPCVIDVDGDDERASHAVARALDPRFRSSVAGALNPYGDGKAAPRIAELLLGCDLSELLRKRFDRGPA